MGRTENNMATNYCNGVISGLGIQNLNFIPKTFGLAASGDRSKSSLPEIFQD